MSLPCAGSHDGCRAWGWRLVARARAAHFFERVVDETSLRVYASSSSLCGKVQIGNAGEHWRGHPHAGVVALCDKCCARLVEHDREGTNGAWSNL